MEQTILEAFNKLSNPDPEVIFSGVEDLSKFIYKTCDLDDPANATASSSTSSTKSTKRNKGFISQLHTSKVKDFLALQDSFAFNIASRLVTSFTRLSKERHLVLTLNTIEGLCLLHYPTRAMFKTDYIMSSVISQLGHESPKVQIAAINCLVSTMVREVDNIRKFEQLNGLESVSRLFKSKDTPKDVKVEILEFLFFYLIPETQNKAFAKPDRKTTEEKSKILGRYLSNVKGLVRELNTSTPFCNMDLEW